MHTCMGCMSKTSSGKRTSSRSLAQHWLCVSPNVSTTAVRARSKRGATAQSRALSRRIDGSPHVASRHARIASATAEAPLEIDVVLYHDANRTGSTHRVAAEPQLCYEDEGHSAFDTNIGGGVDTHISEHPGGRKKLR